MTTQICVQNPPRASSMELSTTSNTIWCRPEPSSVSPIYIPGRLRTASRPFNTRIDSAPYSTGMECSVSAIDCRAGSVMYEAFEDVPNQRRKMMADYVISATKDEARLAQSLHQQTTEEMGFFSSFSRYPRARSEGPKKRDSSLDLRLQKPGFSHHGLTVNGRGPRTC